MALSILEKVGLQKQAATLKSELKAGELGILDKLAKQRELAAIMAKLKGEVVKPAPAEVDEEGSDQEAEETLSMRYLRGDFNQESPVDFRKRILAVADEGMVLDDVKAGVTRWIEANPELIAA